MTKDTSWELWSHVLPKVRTKFLQKLGLRLDQLKFLARKMFCAFGTSCCIRNANHIFLPMMFLFYL